MYNLFLENLGKILFVCTLSYAPPPLLFPSTKGGIMYPVYYIFSEILGKRLLWWGHSPPHPPLPPERRSSTLLMKIGTKAVTKHDELAPKQSQ